MDSRKRKYSNDSFGSFVKKSRLSESSDENEEETQSSSFNFSPSDLQQSKPDYSYSSRYQQNFKSYNEDVPYSANSSIDHSSNAINSPTSLPSSSSNDTNESSAGSSFVYSSKAQKMMVSNYILR